MLIFYLEKTEQDIVCEANQDVEDFPTIWMTQVDLKKLEKLSHIKIGEGRNDAEWKKQFYIN
jgi:hypothetical protein